MSASPLSPPDGIDTGRLDGASKLRIYSALGVIVLLTGLVPLQYIMVASAMQKVAKGFPDVEANVSWALILTVLVGAAAAPLVGTVTDVYGKQRVLVAGGFLFTAGCLIDALTHDWALFLISRGLQGLSVATVVAAVGLLRDLMPRKLVPVAMGLMVAGGTLAASLAAVTGGFLVDRYDWPAVFWFLAIFGVISTPLVWLLVPESKLRVRQRINPAGVRLLTIGTVLVLLYLNKVYDWGWFRPTTWALLIGGVLLLALFVFVESRMSSPLMDLALLRQPKMIMILLINVWAQPSSVCRHTRPAISPKAPARHS